MMYSLKSGLPPIDINGSMVAIEKGVTVTMDCDYYTYGRQPNNMVNILVSFNSIGVKSNALINIGVDNVYLSGIRLVVPEKLIVVMAFNEEDLLKIKLASWQICEVFETNELPYMLSGIQGYISLKTIMEYWVREYHCKEDMALPEEKFKKRLSNCGIEYLQLLMKNMMEVILNENN